MCNFKVFQTALVAIWSQNFCSREQQLCTEKSSLSSTKSPDISLRSLLHVEADFLSCFGIITTFGSNSEVLLSQTYF